MRKNIRFRAVPLFLLAVLTACAHSPETKGEAAFYTKLGISALLSDNCTEALRYLLEAEKRNAEDAELQNALGLAYYCKAEYVLAIRAYEKAVTLKPDFSEAHNNLGAAYAAAGRFDEAVAAFDRAIADLLYATPERAWLNRGDAFSGRFDSANAQQSYQKAVAIAMPKPEARDVACMAYNKMGVVHMRDKKYVEAVQALSKAVKLCPKFAEPYAQLSNAYLRVGQRTNAIKACERVKSMAPGSRDADQCNYMLELLKGKEEKRR